MIVSEYQKMFCYIIPSLHCLGVGLICSQIFSSDVTVGFIFAEVNLYLHQ